MKWFHVHFPEHHGVELIFLGLLTIVISPYKESVESFGPFFYWVINILEIGLQGFFYVLGTNFSIVAHVRDIFFQLVARLFIVHIVCLMRRSF